MTVQVTLSLPENLVEQVKRYGRATRQDVESVLLDTLETVWPLSDPAPAEEFYTPVAKLSDCELCNQNGRKPKRLIRKVGKPYRSSIRAAKDGKSILPGMRTAHEFLA